MLDTTMEPDCPGIAFSLPAPSHEACSAGIVCVNRLQCRYSAADWIACNGGGRACLIRQTKVSGGARGVASDPLGPALTFSDVGPRLTSLFKDRDTGS